MIKNIKTIILFVAILILTACNLQTLKPTETPTASATPPPTDTNTIEPTETSTIAPTLTVEPFLTFTPLITDIPRPAALKGKILLSGLTNAPFVTTIDIRQGKTFTLITRGYTNSSGDYEFTNLQPGLYEIWVLLSNQPVMIQGCQDVAPPDAAWKMGIAFSESQALTMENAYLSKSLMLAKGLQDSGMNATGFYAVLTDFQIKSVIENQEDITLYCK